MMHDLDNYSIYKSILCLNGDLPPLSFFLNRKLPIIAADGAANRLAALGIKPNLILGDLDSVHPHLLREHSHLHLPDQSTSDYQKSLAYLKSNDLLPTILLGINGGHLDHVLNNMNLFMETECLLYAPPLKGFVMKGHSSVDLNLPHHTKISLIGIPKAQVSSEGLKWNLNKTLLFFPGTTSCFNRSESSIVKLKVHKGLVLVLVYEGEIWDAGRDLKGA